MDKTNKIKLDLWEIILIATFSLMSFGYIGLFTRYRYIPSISSIIIIIFLLVLKRYPVRKPNLFLMIIFMYLIMSWMILNIDTGFYYIIIFTIGVLVFMLNKKEYFYIKLYDWFESISFIFAIGTIMNYFFPNLYIDLFRFIMTYSQIATVLRNISHGGYPGLAGEVSFNAFCISIGFCILMSKTILNKNKKKLNIFKLLLIYYALILTNKRSLIMILPFITILIYIMIIYKSKNSLKKVLMVNGFLIFPFIYRFYLIDIVTNLLNKGGDSLQLSNREWFWDIAFDMIKSNPIFGHGINKYDVFYNYNKTRSGYIYFAGAHNSFLQFIAELGYFGGVMYIAFILVTLYGTFTTFIKIIKSSNYNDKLLITTSLSIQLMCIIYSFSENPFYQPQQLFVYFLFSGIAMIVRRKNISNRREVIYENSDC